MNKTPVSAEEGLRQELIDLRQYPNDEVNAYLTSLPAEEANALLAQFAEKADREHPTIWSYILAVFLVILLVDTFVDLPAGRKEKERQAGIRAALYLARRSDLRAVVPLARTWDPRLLSKSEYQEQIEQSLIQLLSRIPPGSDIPLPSGPLAELAERVWRSKRRGRDLTASRADLLVALIPLLSSRIGETQNTLQMLQDGASGANRARVRDAARLAAVQR